METPEQAARYWQMRHAEAHIELAKGTRRILELQNEVAAVSKRHVDAAIETQQDLKSLTAARAEVERLKAALAEEKRLHAAAEEARRCAIATLAGCHELVDQAAIPGLERDRMQSLQVRISALIELAAKPVPVAPPPAEVERLKASLAEEKRERAKWGSEARTAMATLRECHELIDKAAIPRLEHARMLSLQDRIRFLLERAANPVHVAPPPADTASCEQHLQERIEELEAELKAARADLSAARRYCEGIEAERIAHLRTINDVHAMLDRLRIGRVGICSPRSLSERVYSLHERSQHPAIDSIHAALDRAGVPRDEPAEMPPRTRPKTPQSRIENLAAQRDLHRDVLDLVRADLRCGKQEVTADVAKRCRKDADLLTWLDKVGDLVVLNLRVGPVCVKRGATGAHKTLRDALEAIRNSEIESVVRREAVK